jgi:signal transduction histidine kinase
VINEQIRTTFILQMSHELYTPLTVIKGYTHLLMGMQGEQPTPETRFLHQIAASAETLGSMIAQMLDVAGMIRGGFWIKPRLAPVGDIIQRAVDNRQESIAQKDLHVEVALVAADVICECDPDRLQWAVDQLIRNATMYTLPGGSIRVRLNADTDWINLEVSDTGVGIAPHELPHIFDQFYRGHPTAPDASVIDQRGTGLGLFIAKQVVEAHGGVIKVRSKVGQGSQFLVKMPLRQQEARQDVQSEVIS